jgi:Amt family ammonium transporter
MTGAAMTVNENTDLGYPDYEAASQAAKDASVPVENYSTNLQAAGIHTGINKVVIVTKLSRYEKIKKALNDLGVTGITVTQVTGCGIEKGAGQMYRGVEMDMTLLPKIKLEVVVGKISVDNVIETAKKTLYTGKIGDGKIFVYPVSRVVKIRTGEENYEALQDVE